MRFELRNLTVGAAIPRGFKLRLLTEDLQPFPNNEDIPITAGKQLYVEIALEPFKLTYYIELRLA